MNTKAMKRLIHIFIMLVMIGVLSYVIAPVFLHSKNQTTGLNSSTVIDRAQEVVQKIKSTFNLQSTCSAPFRYAIGTVDPRFNISREAENRYVASGIDMGNYC